MAIRKKHPKVTERAERLIEEFNKRKNLQAVALSELKAHETKKPRAKKSWHLRER